jgi:prepilin-type N-terminal cleavage/methylation domain-containing protein
MLRTCRASVARGKSLRAFTLVEILIVVVILGILASIVVPQFASATQQSRIGAASASLRGFERGFIMFYADNLSWPQDRGPGTFPPEMEGYLREADWQTPPPLGEDWDWNIGGAWVATGPNISMRSTTLDFVPDWETLDGIMDDGDTGTGIVQRATVGGNHLLLRVR